jgi:hypothetical protein
MLGSNDGGLRAFLTAARTSLGALAPRGPVGELAVDGTRLNVAGAMLSTRAFVTTMSSVEVDDIVARLLASTAGFRASSPGVPRVYTVDRAGVSVAVLFSLEGRAGNTAVLGSGLDSAGTLLYTTAAVFITRGPLAPYGDVAIDRTLLGLASIGLTQSSTHDTTMSNISDDGTSMGQTTTTARLGASTCCAPGGKLAIYGAGLCVASTLLSEWTFVTAMQRSLNGTVLPHLGTATTSFVAVTPGKPSVLAIHRARMNVASIFVGKGRA